MFRSGPTGRIPQYCLECVSERRKARHRRRYHRLRNSGRCTLCTGPVSENEIVCEGCRVARALAERVIARQKREEEAADKPLKPVETPCSGLSTPMLDALRRSP